MTQTAVADLTRLADYRESRQHLFPSKGSLDWFVRQHKTSLVQAGALLMVAGQWFADPVRFDGAVVSIGAERARAHLEAA